MNVGFLHPGEMGISLAASARRAGHAACWASEGRSRQTQERAEEHGLRDVGTLEAMCRSCPVIVSVCPPHAAEEVARQVAGRSFDGVYLDANAISPARAIRIGEAIQAAGASFIDGGVIGGPAWEPGETWLYLCGPEAERVAACFVAGPVEVSILKGEIGTASALKMCYAAYTKGTSALLCAILAAAETLGVRAELEAQWERDEEGFSPKVQARVRRVTRKAWRFAGEMDEIAATFRDAGGPGGFHEAAAEIYRRLALFKGRSDLPGLEAVLDALSGTGDPPDR
jgi:3-hydroxyisobutyrate dehydrogenase-like beta-hydroxyacid dehydrogenase